MRFDLHGSISTPVADAPPGALVRLTRGGVPFVGIAAIDPSSGTRFLVDLGPGEGRAPAMLTLGSLGEEWCLATRDACVDPDLSDVSVVPGAVLTDVRSGELAIHGAQLLLAFRVSRTMGRGHLDLATGELVSCDPTARLVRVTRWKLLPSRPRDGFAPPRPVYAHPAHRTYYPDSVRDASRADLVAVGRAS
ncbi:MAG: hypothetical protein GC201_10475 [Alphaproteobacteria bacterium]|nr:hypothetical protein [Alphaproteobacteria bacterium]